MFGSRLLRYAAFAALWMLIAAVLTACGSAGNTQPAATESIGRAQFLFFYTTG